MKSLLGFVFLLLGLFMLFSSMTAQTKINGLTQNRFIGVFENYNNFMKEYPIVQKMANFVNTDETNKSNSNMVIALIFIVLGIVLIVGGMTPSMGAVILGVGLLVIFLCFRYVRLQLN